MDGYNKLDPPTKKKLPVEVDVPECIAARKTQGCAAKINNKYRSASLMAAIGDLCLIALYYLLRIGEYIRLCGFPTFEGKAEAWPWEAC